MAAALRIGLTGGIASGKTTVANMFAELGAPVVDTDEIAREVVAPGAAALEEIRATFGDGVFDADGSLDRAAMRALVFSDAERRAALEAVLHPKIRAQAMQQVQAIADRYVIVVVPLLAESPLQDEMNRILVVDCSEEAQLARLMDRDAEDEAQARRMMAAQASREERLAIADDVIVNEGDLAETRRQVEELHFRYLALQEAHGA